VLLSARAMGTPTPGCVALRGERVVGDVLEASLSTSGLGVM
jgi:hypothetical protein